MSVIYTTLTDEIAVAAIAIIILHQTSIFATSKKYLLHLIFILVEYIVKVVI